MKKSSHTNFLYQFIGWLVFFQITRLVFVGWNFNEFKDLPVASLLALPLQSLRLDAAMSSYFMAIPYLLYVLAIFTQRSFFLKLNQYFTGLLVAVVSMITIGELPIYDEWRTKLNLKAVSYLSTPSEVIQTATTGQLVGGILGIISLSFIGIYLFKKWAHREVPLSRRPWLRSVLFSLLVPGLLVLGLRGGIQQIPIQVSDAYYSEHQVLNLAATNSVFNLMSSLLHNSKAGKPYEFLPGQEAEAVFKALHQPPGDSTVQVLTTQKPNIVLVILESWTADVIKSNGGYEGLTPHFEGLIKDGLFFNNCYASGLRSDQGMVALFGGFPAQPRTSIIRQTNKYGRLPCFIKPLKKAGYHTSFLFGGQLSYSNIRAYLYFNGFHRITEGKDFKSNIRRGKLGVHDADLFDRKLQDLATEPTPFFAAVFTGSTHSPFDAPMRQAVDWGDKYQPFLNSVVYADSCLHDFMEKAKKTSWYEHTLFVFVADHSHPSPRNWPLPQPDYWKIPLLLYGPALKPEYRGMVDSLTASQTDLAATLLHQLGLASDDLRYSKDLLNPSGPRHAFFTFDEGICVVKPDGRLCWHVRDKRVDFEKVNSEAQRQELAKQGQAYLQVLMKDYFDF